VGAAQGLHATACQQQQQQAALCRHHGRHQVPLLHNSSSRHKVVASRVLQQQGQQGGVLCLPRQGRECQHQGPHPAHLQLGLGPAHQLAHHLQAAPEVKQQQAKGWEVQPLLLVVRAAVLAVSHKQQQVQRA
jgi:hypothetical protein